VPEAQRRAGGFASLLARLREGAHLMVGLTDYDAYVAHRRHAHPGEPVMSRAEFVRERQEKRYAAKAGGPPRCC
jgi:uncharacterized short protein YbdD (DUF466 family)